MKLILHVGCYKTGSTSIQNTLYVNRSEFLSDGINYLFSGSDDLQRGLINSGNGKQLGHVKLPIKELSKYFQDSPGDVHVLSDECLWHREIKKKVINSIAESGVYDDILVVCYVRRQDQYVESFYK